MAKRMGTNIETTKLEKACSQKEQDTNCQARCYEEMMDMQQSNDNYVERIDCNASCCCGCKDDQVEASVEGGKVCWSCLSKLTIRPAVCSVARSLPAHKTCHKKCFPLNREIISNKSNIIIYITKKKHSLNASLFDGTKDCSFYTH